MSLFKPRSGHFRPIAFWSIPVFFFMLFFFFGSRRRWGRERQRGYNDKDKCDGAIPIPIPLLVMDEATDMGESVEERVRPKHWSLTAWSWFRASLLFLPCLVVMGIDCCGVHVHLSIVLFSRETKRVRCPLPCSSKGCQPLLRRRWPRWSLSPPHQQMGQWPCVFLFSFSFF